MGNAKKAVTTALASALASACFADATAEAAALMKEGHYAEAYAAYTNLVFAADGEGAPSGGERGTATESRKQI